MSWGALLLPLVAALGYALGAIAVKRALGAGASGGQVNLFCNVVMAAMFQLLWLIPCRETHPFNPLIPAACGLLFFLGQICTFRAIAAGDVSVATPLLGTKVLLVALFSVFLIGKALPAAWWWASLLATAGIGLISYAPGGRHRHLLATVGWSLAASAVFALTDVMVQRGVPEIGYGRFAPVMFGSMGLLSMLYLPGLARTARRGAELPRAALPWLAGGGLLLALQALGMYSAIGLYGSATATNILYGSRCLWSVLLVWMLRSLAGAPPTNAGSHRGLMLRRLGGALLLFLAMALVLR
jgi:drug/metabolite transporter (DMT)-like permease